MDDGVLVIGRAYIIPDKDGNDVEGVLESAAVLPQNKSASCSFRYPDGARGIVSIPLTPGELKQYEVDPEGFFGGSQHVGHAHKNYEDVYNFLHATYSKSSKEKLLEFMASEPNIESLSTLTQEELAKMFCKRMALQMAKETKLKESLS